MRKRTFTKGHTEENATRFWTKSGAKRAFESAGIGSGGTGCYINFIRGWFGSFRVKVCSGCGWLGLE